MIPKQFRLKNKFAFDATYKIRHSTHSGGVTLYAGLEKSSEEYLTKVGFVVSKKTHKRAVKRNRLKRLMRESYRNLLKSNELGNSNKYRSLIFIGTSNALEADYNKIHKSMKKMLETI